MTTKKHLFKVHLQLNFIYIFYLQDQLQPLASSASVHTLSFLQSLCLFVYWTYKSDLCARHNSLLLNPCRKLQNTTPYRIATGKFYSTGENTRIHPGHG